MAIEIREERAEDAQDIAIAVKEAYSDVPWSDHCEHLMVERLRETDAFVPSLSLVAIADGHVVGHILLTVAHIRDKEDRCWPILALAPLSVVPKFRGQGVGKRLLLTAHEHALKLGFKSIVVVGVEGYYDQFGYESLSKYAIRLPVNAPEKLCRLIALTPGALDSVSGEVMYASGWLDH